MARKKLPHRNIEAFRKTSPALASNVVRFEYPYFSECVDLLVATDQVGICLALGALKAALHDYEPRSIGDGEIIQMADWVKAHNR